MTALELNHVYGIRAVLLTMMVIIGVGMIGKLIYAFRKLSLGQKLFFLGSLCMVLYAGDAMRDAIQAGLGWKWRLVPGLIGAASLFGWMLEPLALQRRLWGQPSFTPPIDLMRAATHDTQVSWVGQVSDYAIFALSTSGKILTWNAGAEALKGYTAKEVIGKSFSIFYTPEDQRNGLPFRLLEIARTTGRVETTGWRVRKDGTRFWGDVVITLVRDQDGHAAGFVKIVRDLTQVPKVEPPSESSTQ